MKRLVVILLVGLNASACTNVVTYRVRRDPVTEQAIASVKDPDCHERVLPRTERCEDRSQRAIGNGVGYALVAATVVAVVFVVAAAGSGVSELDDIEWRPVPAH